MPKEICVIIVERDEKQRNKKAVNGFFLKSDFAVCKVKRQKYKSKNGCVNIWQNIVAA